MRTFYLISAITSFLFIACNNQPKVEGAIEGISKQTSENDEPVKRGEYLVSTIGCNDCHSTKKFTQQGPVIDSSKLLAGYIADSKLPPVNANALKPGQWINMAPDLTAFVGPWGVSYTANLTPDSTTGIGAWSEAVFIKTIRTGKHLGNPNGRDILPPMPWYNFAKMTDDDLGAIYAYLRSIPPVKNKVPQPIPPTEIGGAK